LLLYFYVSLTLKVAGVVERSGTTSGSAPRYEFDQDFF
jgi:hypothetical protein